MKPLEEMNVIDNFLFTEIMADEENGLEVCRMILSCVLMRKVGNIRFTGGDRGRFSVSSFVLLHSVFDYFFGDSGKAA